jgi:hypothetical protein
MNWKRVLPGLVFAGLSYALYAVVAPPPLPPVPKRPHKSAAVHQGAGAAALIVKRAPAVVSKLAFSANRKLVWDWAPNPGNQWTNVVFVVRSNSTLSTPRGSWPIFRVVSTNSCALAINQSAAPVFFFVFASNTVTHLVAP